MRIRTIIGAVLVFFSSLVAHWAVNRDDPNAIYKRYAINSCSGEEKVKSIREAFDTETKQAGKLVTCTVPGSSEDGPKYFKAYPPSKK